MRQWLCIVCTSPAFHRKGLFCDYCEKKIKERYGSIKTRQEGTVPHYYLFDWNEETDFLCRKIVYFIKGQKGFYDKALLSPFLQIKKDTPPSLVYTCPASHRLVNHGAHLAQYFMKLFEGESVLEVEVSEDEDMSQKKKNRYERLLRSQPYRAPASPKRSNWVFVDDVLVTGGTYYKIYESVGKRPAALLTLFYRESF